MQTYLELVHQARSHGGRGGAEPPPLWKNLSPPIGCAVPFAVTSIGIEVYPPPGILSAPPANDTWLRRCSPRKIEEMSIRVLIRPVLNNGFHMAHFP